MGPKQVLGRTLAADAEEHDARGPNPSKKCGPGDRGGWLAACGRLPGRRSGERAPPRPQPERLVCSRRDARWPTRSMEIQ
jgi:hypothetical protein